VSSTRSAITLLAACLTLASVACSGAPDDPTKPSAPSGQAPGGPIYDESGDPIPGDEIDPTAGEEGEGEGSGDLPAVDAGAADGGDAGTPASDAAPTIDSGSVPPPPAPGDPAASLIATEAKRELAAMKYSTYEHTTSVDESKGQFIYDCSGFVGYDLSRVLPDAFSTLKAATVTRPLAKDFETFFASIPITGKTGRWHRVVRVADLVPGDIVAWLKPADVASSNTGHVLIVRLAVSKNPKRADEWLVPITDSTATPHGATDSRTAAGTTGLGTGTIGLLVDTSGAPVGYRWTGGVSAHDELTSVSLGHAE
jgi:hypothetical protein